MTVNDIYQKAKLWMFEKPSSNIYDNYAVEICNKVLAELYDENNMARMFKGKLPFIDGVVAHQVSNFTDEIDYEDEYQYDVIPKGMESYFFMDDDLQKKSILDVEYNNARVKYQRLVSDDIVNKLWEEAENAE